MNKKYVNHGRLHNNFVQVLFKKFFFRINFKFNL